MNNKIKKEKNENSFVNLMKNSYVNTITYLSKGMVLGVCVKRVFTPA
jgi:hypothetical protein